MATNYREFFFPPHLKLQPEFVKDKCGKISFLTFICSRLPLIRLASLSPFVLYHSICTRRILNLANRTGPEGWPQEKQDTGIRM